MSECAKCKVKKKDPLLVGCEGTCRKWFHHSCVGLTDANFKFLNDNKCIVFICDNCRLTCNVFDKSALSKVVDHRLNAFKTELTALFSEKFKDFTNKISDELLHRDDAFVTTVSSKLDEFGGCLAALGADTQFGGSPASYSSAVVKQKSALVVHPKKSDQPIGVTKSDILLKVNPVSTDIEFSSTHETRDGGLVIRCDNVDDTKKILDIASDKLGENYVVKPLSTINPRIRIVGLSQQFDDESLLSYLCSQNKSVFFDDSTSRVISVKPLKKNNKVFQAILQVDLGTYSRLICEGHVFVGYDYCRVFDAVEVTRCFKCCGFHHYADKCSKKDHICPRCAGPHKVSDCGSHSLKCINCSNSNDTRGSQYSVDHCAWDTGRCHVYLETLSRFKSNIFGLK